MNHLCKIVCLLLLLCFYYCLATAQKGVITAIQNSKPTVILNDGTTSSNIEVARKWNGNFCKTTLHNNGTNDVRIREVILMQANRLFDGNTSFYAEGFQMLSQYNGTLALPKIIGGYDDAIHYRLPQPDGYRVVYNVLILHGNDGSETLMGFNSSIRYIGKFYISADTIKVVMEMDNTLLKKDASIKLEEFSLMQGKDVNGLTAEFAKRINYFHPLVSNNVPSGWCSWYCFGPDVSAKNITDNLAYIKQNIPQLKYIQLDDGYQTHMGDWLTTGKSFGGNIKAVLQQIKASGFEPAIWVAPFICDSGSSIYKEHPDWLVKDSAGKPLRSDKVGFGGWRLAPWYVLDGSNPAVQQHLTNVFKTMSTEWGCTYFKLDANYWGAVRGGVYYDSNATRVTAYRSGMEAVRKGAGKDAFLLGCNHPLWPSLGLINGSRSSNDIDRSWFSFTHTGEENLLRAWQNGKLWWNDPDCILLTGTLPKNEYMYHASLLFATGGMMLSGDDLAKISAERLAILRKMAPSGAAAAQFNNDLSIGWIRKSDTSYLILLNKGDKSKQFSVPLLKTYKITDYWTGIEKIVNTMKLNDELPAHCGKVYKLANMKQ